jgi:LysM repeat protein
MLPAMVRTSDQTDLVRTDPAAAAEAPVPWQGSSPTGIPTASEPPGGFGQPDAICPFLLSADLSWRAATPQREHRCTAVTPRQPLALEVQRELCLVEAHRVCDRFVAATRPRSGRAERHRAGGPRRHRPLARTMPLLIERGLVRNALLSLPIRSSITQAVVVALLVAALVMIAAARVLPAQPAASPSPAPLASVALVTVPSPTPIATPTATLSPSPSSEPTPSVIGAQSPSPSVAARTYQVRAGDTLLGIASRFGTTAGAIMRANNIASPNALRIGQVLVIP